MNPLRIYIAGPYTPRNCSLHDAARQAQKNVDLAIDIANKLIELGCFIFVPHLSHYIHLKQNIPIDPNWWYIEDNSFIEHWATALFYIKSSKGADAELELAKKIGLKIFYTIEEVREYLYAK
jgi:hypothetical protein